MVILDGSGKELITSDGPQGHVGCPVRPHEIDYFMEMLKKTAQRMSPDNLAATHKALEAYAKKVLGGRGG